jgi:tRNA-dihydrouridine synthase 1
MIHAKLFQTSEKYRRTFLPMSVPFPPLMESSSYLYVNNTNNGDNDNNSDTTAPNDITCMDRPLIGQICGSSIEHVIPTAIQLSQYVDAIDINCGCPQNIAKRGNYGAFLLEQESYLIQLVQTLTSILTIPVTVKVRLLPPPPTATSTSTSNNNNNNQSANDIMDVPSSIVQQQRDESVRRSMILYEKLIHIGNVHMICVHGRTRHQKGVMTGPADWDAIREVVQTFGTTIPIMANGSIANPNDIRQCIQYTNVDGIMSSEALLEYPPLFQNLVRQDYYNHYNTSKDGIHTTTGSVDHVIPPNQGIVEPVVVVNGITLAQQYYDIATQYPPNVHGQGSNNIKVIKIHIHRFCHYYLQNDLPLRQLLINALTMEALWNVIELLQQKYGSSSSSSLTSTANTTINHNPASLSWYYRHRGKVRDCFGVITNTTATTAPSLSLSETGGPTLLQAQMEQERTVKSNIDIVIDDDAADCFNALFQMDSDD